MIEAETVFKYDDFVFLIDEKFKKRNLLDRTTLDIVTLEMVHGDENASFGYTNITMDDIKTLDLPVMYYKPPNECQVVDHYSSTKFEDASKTFNSSSEYLQGSGLQGFSWLKFDDFTEEAIRIYRLLSQRQPIQFPIYKDNTLKTSDVEPIGHLPIMLFMLQRPILKSFDKNTGIPNPSFY